MYSKFKDFKDHFKNPGLFKDLPKLPLKFNDFSRISMTCLKFKNFKDFFKDVVGHPVYIPRKYSFKR